ncbi:MAG TPA: nucleotidyltransferase domain-containing protein [Caldilineaceae bacterium]|nr:nucleotidyltransferase domain-containing protein [Caldilineaceae bacterium]
MTNFALPTAFHTSALETVLAELKANPNVLGVILVGSLARGTARRDSDIDLLIVQTTGERVTARHSHGPIVVECTFRTAAMWTQQFTPMKVGDESWGYAFLDGLILYDPGGVVAELVDSAAQAHATYQTPKQIVEHYIWLWSHVRPKMERVLHSGDTTEIGWSAAVMMHPIMQTVWAINNRPLPSLDLGCVQRHLNDLTLPPNAPDLIREMLQVSPESALRLQLQILDTVESLLQRQADLR